MLRFLLVACAASTVASFAAAQQRDTPAVFVQGGAGEDGVKAASVGLAWALPWHTLRLGREISTRVEVFASDWRTARIGGGHRSLLQLGAVPMVRVRPQEGRSPWFLEGGIGVSLLDREFETPHRTFSTRLNFSYNVGLGRSFGPQGEQEVSLRWQHTSNAGIRKPNPGLDLLLVRYSARF
ncbi:MAG: acyloxyacyl hydrolase [Ramlibacter sp.]